MMAEHRKRVEDAVTEMINEIYKTHLRKMQLDMHSCAANCCNDLRSRPSMDNVQNCIEDCAGPMIRAQDYMQQELGEFQIGLQDCVMRCNDNVHGRVPDTAKVGEISKYSDHFEKCTGKCADQYLNLIPKMMRTMKSVLAQGRK